MSGVLRLFLICFIAVAVPLKGLAAVTMGGCGPGHDPPRQSTALIQHTVNVGFHGAHEDIRADSYGGATQAMDAARQTVSDLSTGHAAQLKMKCSGCAPCCGVAALAPERVGTSQVPSASADLVFLEIYFPAVFADVPHRPPRLTLA